MVRASLWEPKFRAEAKDNGTSESIKLERVKRMKTVISTHCRRPTQRLKRERKRQRRCWCTTGNERKGKGKTGEMAPTVFLCLKVDANRACCRRSEFDEVVVVIRSNHHMAYYRETHNWSSMVWQCNRVGAIYRQVPLTHSFLCWPLKRVQARVCKCTNEYIKVLLTHTHIWTNKLVR